MKLDIYKNSTREFLSKFIQTIKIYLPTITLQTGKIKIKYHIMRHFNMVCTVF